MKNIFTTIEYVAEKITEAITGHKNDEQAHPNLSEQINVLLLQQNIKTYTSLEQINLTDTNFSSLTQSQGFDKLVEVMGDYAELKIKLSSSLNNFRTSILGNILGVSGIGNGLLYISTYNSGRYDVSITSSDATTISYFSSGYPSTFHGWKEIATTTKTDILSTDFKNGWKQYSVYYVTFNTVGDSVTMNGVITNDSDTQVYATLMTLPLHLRPKVNRYIKLISSNTSLPTVPVVIKTNGDIETQSFIQKETQLFLQGVYSL